jgi:8-oxo-dGTP pyrophosphatase MutT (NUDIX family)
MTGLPVRDQVSAGGVAWRPGADGGAEVAVVLVDSKKGRRWQLPTGLVDEGESPEAAARREVREEAGIEVAATAEPLETVEYWYVATERGGGRVRFHKRVHFFLFPYERGDTADHDHEVLEARWVPIAEAERMLAFRGERKVLALARERVQDTR